MKAIPKKPGYVAIYRATRKGLRRADGKMWLFWIKEEDAWKYGG